MSVRLPFLVLLAALSACSTQPSDEIPGGIYSGSTSRDVAVSVEIGGGSTTVNDRTTERVRVDDNRSFVVKKEEEQAASFVDKSKWECDVAFKGKEIHCDVTWSDGRKETIEMMQE